MAIRQRDPADWTNWNEPVWYPVHLEFDQWKFDPRFSVHTDLCKQVLAYSAPNYCICPPIRVIIGSGISAERERQADQQNMELVVNTMAFS